MTTDSRLDEWDDLPLANRDDLPLANRDDDSASTSTSTMISGNQQHLVADCLPQGSLPIPTLMPEGFNHGGYVNCQLGAIPGREPELPLPVVMPIPANTATMNSSHVAGGIVQTGPVTTTLERRGKQRPSRTTPCRQFAAGFCRFKDGDCKLGNHDAVASEQERRAWLGATELPDTRTWSNGGRSDLREVRLRGVTSVLLVADIPIKEPMAEFTCLAFEASTSKQLSRFHRYIRVAPSNGEAGANVASSSGINPQSSALPFPAVLDELQRWMKSLGLNPGVRNEAGYAEDGNFRWVVCGDSGLRLVPDHLARNFNVPVPDHLRSWTDIARVCALAADRMKESRGLQSNGGGRGVQAGPTGEALPAGGLATHGGRTSDGGMPSEAHSLPATPGKRSKKRTKPHCLPRSGLAGMFKFLGASSETLSERRARGMDTVVGVAQCATCLVRHGMAMPVTSRISQSWSHTGDYEGSLYTEVPPPDSLPGAVPDGGGWGASPHPRATVASIPGTPQGSGPLGFEGSSLENNCGKKYIPTADRVTNAVASTATTGRGGQDMRASYGVPGASVNGTAGVIGMTNRSKGGGHGGNGGGANRNAGSAGQSRPLNVVGGGATAATLTPGMAAGVSMGGPISGNGGVVHEMRGKKSKRKRALAAERVGVQSVRPSVATVNVGENGDGGDEASDTNVSIPEENPAAVQTPIQRPNDKKKKGKKQRAASRRRDGAHSVQGPGGGDGGRNSTRDVGRDNRGNVRGAGARGVEGSGEGLVVRGSGWPVGRGSGGGMVGAGSGAMVGEGSKGVVGGATGDGRSFVGGAAGGIVGGAMGAIVGAGGGVTSGAEGGIVGGVEAERVGGVWGGGICRAGGGGMGGAGSGAIIGSGGNRASGTGRDGMGKAGAPTWRKNIPVQSLSKDYLDYSLRDQERHYYKSAGILPYRYDAVTGEVYVLLGTENRKNKLVLTLLAGKREDGDDGPEVTAWREFWEESGKVLGDTERTIFLSACFERRARALWIQSAKMAIMACELTSPGFIELPRCYAEGTGAGVDKSDTDMVALHWISAAELHKACRRRSNAKLSVWGLPSIVSQLPQPQPQHQQHLIHQNSFISNHVVGGGPRGPFGHGGPGAGYGPPTGAPPVSLPLARQLPLQLPLPPQSQPPGMYPQPLSQPQPQQRPGPVAVDIYPMLKNMVTDKVFSIFFENLATTGVSNQPHPSASSRAR